MALRELLLPWDAQPQEAVGINPVWARDCLALVSGAAPINVVNGEVGVTSGVATRYAPGIAGLARTARRGAYGDGREVYTIAPWSGDFTIVWVGSVVGISGGETRAAGVVNSGLTTPRIMVGEYSSKTACTTMPSGGSTVYVREVNQTTGGSRAYIGRLAGTELSFWQDGVLQETKTQSGNDWAGCDRFFVGGVGWIATADADVYLAGLWSRALSDDEIAQISANPWQLFEPRRIHVPVAAGGGGTTVALSGISATFAQTAPAVSSATPLVGESVTANAGILLPAFSRSLSGQAGTAFAGTLNTSTSRALSGQSAAFTAGSVIPSVAIAAIGLQATFASGTLTASSSSGTTVNLVGEPVAFAQTAPSISVTVALTGIAATMAAGILSSSSGTATITVKAGSWLRYKKLQ